MNAKEELENISIWEAKIEGKAEQIQRLEAMAMKTTSALGGEAVSRTRDNDPHGRYMAKKEKLEKDIVALQDENEKRKELLSGIIDKLRNPAHIRVLYGLYFNKKTTVQLAEQLNYSQRNIFNIRDAGISEIQKVLDGINLTSIS